jgi:hypothetical protein
LKKPDLYHFNPTCEYAVANGNPSWQPNQLLQKMEDDLETLPLFFAKVEDYLLLKNNPSDEYLHSLRKLGITVPNFITQKNAFVDNKFLSLPLNKLIPWGWSPVVHKLFSPLKSNCSRNFLDSPVSNWKPEHKNLFSKGFARSIQKIITSEYPTERFLSDKLLTQICTSREEIEILLNRWGKLMVKAPWSSSGRGLQAITKSPIHQKVWEKLLGFVNEQGYVIVEPFLNKVLDLGFLFELKNGKISYLGTSNFSTNKKGQYQGNYLNGLPDNLNKEIISFAKFIPGKIIQPLIKTIEASDLAKYYEGNFGIDTLIFLDENSELKINPCLEINVRQSMGLLSLNLEKLILPREKGMFKIFYQPGLSFFQFKSEMEKKYPLLISGNQIKSGFFALSESTKNTSFGAYLLV